MKQSLALLGLIIATTCAPSPCADANEPSTQPASDTATSKPANVAGERHDHILELRMLQLQLAFEANYDRRESEFDTTRWSLRNWRQSNQVRRFEESLGLDAAGVVLDERVLEFDLSIRGGWSQERFTERGPGRNQVENPNGTLFEYDVSATLFPRGKLSVTGFAQRLDSRIPRAFQPSLDRSRERYGVDIHFSHERLPMRLSLEHQRDELTSRTRALRDDERRDRDTLRYEATWQIDTHHALRFDYEYDDRREEYSGSDTRFDTRRHYVTLDHTLRFGKDHRSAWETLARFQDETGDLSRDMAELSSRLRLQHTDALSTHYAVQYLRDSFQELRTETYRGEIGLTHKWSDALTTTMQLHAFEQHADENSDLFEWGGLLNASYAQDNPLGRFSANASYNYTQTDTRNGDRRGVIIAEAVTLRDPLPSYLTHVDIEHSSIVVTDADRTRTYLPLRDYVIIHTGRYTAIQRIATGQINDRQTVLVSYTYRTFGDYNLSRHRVDLRIQQAFKCGLTPYYAASIQDEDLDEARYLTFRVRNVNRHRIGTTFRRPRWSAGVEYEYNDDAVDPYQAVHLNGDVILWQNARAQLDGKGSASRFWFDGSYGLEPRNATLVDLGLSYRHLILRDLEATASAMYRWENDSLFGRTQGVDVTGGVEWRIGLFALSFEAEYDVLDLPDSRDNTLALWLKVKRDIPIIGGAAR